MGKRGEQDRPAVREEMGDENVVVEKCVLSVCFR